jgi:hypothetical protein
MRLMGSSYVGGWRRRRLGQGFDAGLGFERRRRGGSLFRERCLIHGLGRQLKSALWLGGSERDG